MTRTDAERILKVRDFKTDISGVKAFQSSQNLVADGIIGPKTTAALLRIKKYGSLLTEPLIRGKYGAPGEVKNLTTITLPFPMVVAWDTKSRIYKVQTHKLVATRFLTAWTEVLEIYGIEAIKELRLDYYGGCYNFRKMRGGSSWSRHSWAIAWDTDPERNALKMTDKTARFARPEYSAFIQIFYKHGFLNLGVEQNRDWMHMETAN